MAVEALRGKAAVPGHEHGRNHGVDAWLGPPSEEAQVTPAIADLAARLSACRGVLVDSNVLLDVTTNDRPGTSGPAAALAEAGEHRPLVINPIIYAEVSARFPTIDALDAALPESSIGANPCPGKPASWPGSATWRIGGAGVSGDRPYPDFYIGAHAAVGRLCTAHALPGALPHLLSDR